MILLRLLNAQGIAGLAVSLAFAILLLVQKAETRHWKQESGRFERLYRYDQSAFAGTVANYRAAADAARAADLANAERIAAGQHEINERTAHDYEARLAAARTLARRLRGQSATAATDSGRRASAPMPGLAAPTGGIAEAAGQDGLSDADALTATEQAIQLDALIGWVKAQAQVDPSADPPPE
ncbi:MAG TPA: hypothetical protein VFG41_06150 [Sphingomicrobium sp.]|nr:hypothetical protein [Sphingomicrobium sp.]